MAASDNSLTASNIEIWTKEMQMIMWKELVALAIADTDLRAQLHEGDTFHKPYRSALKPADYTRGTAVTIQGITDTDESGSVDTIKTVPFYVDDVDKIQNHYPTMKNYAGDCQRYLNTLLDQAVTGQVTNAGSYIDEGDISGGTAGTYITPSASNIQQIFTAASRKLDALNVSPSNRFALLGSRLMEMVRLYIGGKDTDMADVVGNNGKVMNRFGFELYYSNNCYWSATLSIGSSPTAGDTVSIAGVTFTVVSTIGTTAGNVLDHATASTFVDYLVDAINGEEEVATEGTHYVEVSAANRRRLTQAQIVATDATTSITFIGYGDIATTETLTASGNVWSVQYSRPMFGAKKCVDLVTQLEPDISIREVDNMRGVNVLPLLLYGVKTFIDGATQMVDVRLSASAWTN